MANILVTGGTGLIGRHLCKRLKEKGYSVSILSRTQNDDSGFPIHQWNIEQGLIDQEAITTADYIIHLAGANIADKRWTKNRKKTILDSRQKPAHLIYSKINESNKSIKAFISASAIGYYGAESSEKTFSEDDSPAKDFLGSTCEKWENSTKLFKEKEIRTVLIRTGVVLTSNGGALAKIKTPVDLGIASALGDGKQFLPWIHIDDLCNIYIKAIEDIEKTLEIFPSHLEDRAWRLSLFGDKLEKIEEFDPLTGDHIKDLKLIKIYANSHYITPKPTIEQAIINIKKELEITLKKHKEQNKLLEAQRLEERTKFDLEMIEATGSCAGIENYSRFLSGRKAGEPPPTLFEYFPDNTLIFVDECHVTIPQLNGMFKGDRSRKSTLAEYGFRLPSCMDNRPLKFEEWDMMRTQTVFVSATPGPWELEQTKGKFIDQVIRPTGLIDPPVEVKPAKNQVDDLMHECRKTIKKNHRGNRFLCFGFWFYDWRWVDHNIR